MYNIKTVQFSSFNWIRFLWYPKGVKIVPIEIRDYLSPLALAVWFMDGGSLQSPGAKLNTAGFTHAECIFLSNLLMELYGLKVSVNKVGKKDQYYLYIWKESMPIFDNLVRPHLVPSMLYKSALAD